MIVSRADLVAARTQRAIYQKLDVDLGQPAEADWFLRGGAGSLTPAGTAPGGTPGAICDRSTTGAMQFTPPRAGKKLYIAEVRPSVSGGLVTDETGMGGGRLMLYDRLVHAGGFVWNSTATQTVNTTALSRYTSGEGVMAWLVNIASGGSSAAADATVSYTNQDGTAGRTGVVRYTGFFATGGAYQMELQSGDRGVRSVQSFAWSANVGTTAGNVGVVLGRPLMIFRDGYRYYRKAVRRRFVPEQVGWSESGLPEIDPDACLALLRLGKNAQLGTTYDSAMIFRLVEEE